MQLVNLDSYIAERVYPGRGVLLGQGDGGHAVLAYFIMGRSENSRNRIFVEEGPGLITRAFDESKLGDPSLIIYPPVRVVGESTVVTNGDQTVTVCEHLENGGSFYSALQTRTFEPDPPIFTPRISGIAKVNGGAFSYALSILKSSNNRGGHALRQFFEYETPVAGEGHLIHTYAPAVGELLPPFAGEPVHVALTGDIDSFTSRVWNALNEDNKVSLFVRYISLA
ncbi:IMP cyclohydrolase, partial [Ruminococcaceae bacterium OttesenSCG-928-N02]|nr:IMP cyclohydrolase [Ruminococcaceae bacterium OttesenSCG-928-N02]